MMYLNKLNQPSGGPARLVQSPQLSTCSWESSFLLVLGLWQDRKTVLGERVAFRWLILISSIDKRSAASSCFPPEKPEITEQLPQNLLTASSACRLKLRRASSSNLDSAGCKNRAPPSPRCTSTPRALYVVLYGFDMQSCAQCGDTPRNPVL